MPIFIRLYEGERMTTVAEPLASDLQLQKQAEAYATIEAMSRAELIVTLGAYTHAHNMTPSFLNQWTTTYLKRLARRVYNCQGYIPQTDYTS
jgi:hypothetical protein